MSTVVLANRLELNSGFRTIPAAPRHARNLSAREGPGRHAGPPKLPLLG